MPIQRILFLGMNGAFSLPPLLALLESEHDVLGVVLPGRGPLRRWQPPQPQSAGIPLFSSPVRTDIAHVAWRRGVPIWEVGELEASATLRALAAWQPDVCVMACFSRILPRSWLEAPARGFLNLHPSLLPAYRGPAPLFWQFRHGEPRTGVSIHLVVAEADAGPIVAQAEASLPLGCTTTEAEQRLAETGAHLLLDMLAQTVWEAQPQAPSSSSYQGFPRDEDRVIDATWDVRRAFSFIRGARSWRPFTLVLDEQRFMVMDALDFQEGAALPASYRRRGLVLEAQLQDGILAVLCAPTSKIGHRFTQKNTDGFLNDL